MQGHIQVGLILKFELYCLLHFPVELELYNAAVAADAVAQMHDVVAVAQFRKIEQLVDLRPYR